MSSSRKMVAQRVVAVIRMVSSDYVTRVAEAIYSGGVKTLEVAMTTPDALTSVAQLTAQLPSDALIGVGPVRNVDEVVHAADSGSRFIVSPIVTPQLIESARKHNMAVILGAFTPTEIHRAHH